MYNDLLNPNNYISYNIKLANCIGLNSAIYLSAVIKLSNKSNNVTTTRNQICELTTFNTQEQHSIENNLTQLNYIIITEANNQLNIEIKEDNIISTIIDSDINSISKIKKVASMNKSIAGTGKMSQRQKQFIELKSKIQCSNVELLEAYKDWVDGVYNNPKGFLSARAISVFQKTVDDFAKGDLDLALKIIDIATVGGYRDATWAINAFNKDYASEWRKNHSTTVYNNQQPKKVAVSKEVF